MHFLLILAVILTIQTKSILSQNPSEAVFDFNDPLILDEFQDCISLPSMAGSRPLIRKFYNDSSFTPFRVTSDSFLTTNKSVNSDITQCLCTKALFRGNFSSFSFQIGINFQNNGNDLHNNVQFFVSNIFAFQIDISTSGWKLYERNISIPNLGTFDDSVLGIKVRLGDESDLAIEFLQFFDPQMTNIEPLTTTSISTDSTTDTWETETDTFETEASTTESFTIETDYPATKDPPNENPSCLTVDFNESASLSYAFRECYGQYLPELILKSYSNTTITPFRETSINFLSNKWEGLSCLESVSIFSFDETSSIESAIYLNGLWPGAWLEIVIVDVITDDREVMKFLETDEWRLLADGVKGKFNNAQIFIMSNMNAYSQLAMEYFNIRNAIC